MAPLPALDRNMNPLQETHMQQKRRLTAQPSQYSDGIKGTSDIIIEINPSNATYLCASRIFWNTEFLHCSRSSHLNTNVLNAFPVVAGKKVFPAPRWPETRETKIKTSYPIKESDSFVLQVPRCKRVVDADTGMLRGDMGSLEWTYNTAFGFRKLFPDKKSGRNMDTNLITHKPNARQLPTPSASSRPTTAATSIASSARGSHSHAQYYVEPTAARPVSAPSSRCSTTSTRQDAKGVPVVTRELR
jgi:hypothetical protein